jgi:hypothetical protein
VRAPDRLPPSTAPKLPGTTPARFRFAACVLPAAAVSHPGLVPGRHHQVRSGQAGQPSATLEGMGRRGWESPAPFGARVNRSVCSEGQGPI